MNSSSFMAEQFSSLFVWPSTKSFCRFGVLTSNQSCKVSRGDKLLTSNESPPRVQNKLCNVTFAWLFSVVILKKKKKKNTLLCRRLNQQAVPQVCFTFPHNQYLLKVTDSDTHTHTQSERVCSHCGVWEMRKCLRAIANAFIHSYRAGWLAGEYKGIVRSCKEGLLLHSCTDHSNRLSPLQ